MHQADNTGTTRIRCEDIVDVSGQSDGIRAAMRVSVLRRFFHVAGQPTTIDATPSRMSQRQNETHRQSHTADRIPGEHESRNDDVDGEATLTQSLVPEIPVTN